MAEPKWLKGELTGNCVGKPHRKVGGTGLARWYKLELLDATIGNWQPVAGPPKIDASAAVQPFCQAKLRDARLKARVAGANDEELSLRELSVWDWKMRDQRESAGESRCTLAGTVYALEVDGTRRPALDDDADRLDQWGCLVLLLAMLIGFWIWWSCGPFTCGLWSLVVLTSFWSHRLRTRRRTPPGVGSQILQGVLALVLILGGAGVVIGMNDATRAGVCNETSSLAVLITLGTVIAVSLLTISWPRWWIWAVWTAVVVLWCGRSQGDCAGQWLQRARAFISSSVTPPPTGELPQRGAAGSLFPRGTQSDGGSPDAAPATAKSKDGGTGSGGSGEPGGVGQGNGGSSSINGSGDGGSGNDGLALNPSVKKGGPAEESGPAKSNNEGHEPGGPGGGGRGAGKGNGLGDPDALEAATEPRMTVDAALSDPKRFLDGSSRVTLNGDLLFSFDEDKLRNEAEPRLRQVAQLLRLDPGAKILLEGHSDTIGGDQYNQDLSERRAKAVRSWLVEQAHIDPAQVETVGYGSSKPIVPASKSPNDQAPNRRVEVRVLSGP
jgi:outer membrane protein OmpA-like peptidoglycan-associated protein